MKNNAIWPALVVAVGITLAGACMYLGMSKNADKDRRVTVKGLATRTVQADHAVWPLSYGLSGNDLISLYQDRERIDKTVIELLKSKGFEDDDIRLGNVSVDNNWISYYDRKPEYHYTLHASVVVNTGKVDLVVASQGCQSELLNRGIIVNTNDWQLEYEFNGLSELKPAMIEEATKNARAVAQKFADDAECRLGSIARASQGQFSIESDSYQPWMKHVRVVTTVDYFLD